MNTQVVNVRCSEYDVYIGRGRDPQTGEYPTLSWGNYFSHKDVPGTERVATREEAVARFRAELWARVSNPGNTHHITLEQLAALQGKRLGCWCKPAACHGDVLAAAAEWAAKELAT